MFAGWIQMMMMPPVDFQRFAWGIFSEIINSVQGKNYISHPNVGVKCLVLPLPSQGAALSLSRSQS